MKEVLLGNPSVSRPVCMKILSSSAVDLGNRCQLVMDCSLTFDEVKYLVYCGIPKIKK